MPELLLIIKNFNTNNSEFVTWGIAAIILLFGLMSQSFWIKEFLAEYKLNRLLKRIGTKSLHNITIEDGMDGRVLIENLILLPSKILLLGVKKYRGVIFAAEKIDLWTQVINNKSYKFENPLRQLENTISLLNSKLKNTKIEENILFVKGSEFPKGKPEKVLTIAELKNLASHDSYMDLDESLRKDWEVISKLAVNYDFDKNEGVLVDDTNSSGFSLLSLLISVTALSAWLVWRLL